MWHCLLGGALMNVLKVNNLTRKSFKNYTGPNTTEEFKKKNIIFGYNGRGKSSLAFGIIEEFLKEQSKNHDNIRHFNRNFINENLMLTESDNPKIKGIIANFGKKDVGVEKEILKIEKELIDVEKIQRDIEKTEKVTRDEINKIHDSKKGKTSIQKKSAEKDIREILELYKRDVADAIRIIKSEKELLQIKADDSYEIQRDIIASVNVLKVNLLEEDDIKGIKDIFEKKFDNIEIPSNKIIEWLNTGLEIHEDGDLCNFCGGFTNKIEIQDRVSKYNSNEKRKATIKLNEFKNQLNKIDGQISIFLNTKENVISNLGLGKKISSYFESIAINEGNLGEYIKFIQAKIDDVEKELVFNEEEFINIFESFQKDLAEIEKLKAEKQKEIQNRLDKFATLIKGAIGLEIENSTLIVSNIEKLNRLEQEVAIGKSENKASLEKIENLKASKSNTKDFAEHISSILAMIEVNLRLEVNKDDYVIKHSISDEILKLIDISEGEQNLLALLYFYHELFEDAEQDNIKPTIDLIVIDDPISSVDDINKMYVLELIKKLCSVDKPQVFIFTHVWEDFCNLCYGKKDKQDSAYGFYEIKKDSTGSKIYKAKTNDTPYKHGFKEIYEFSLKSNCSDLHDCEIYHYPNIMRKILEEFLSFKVKKYTPTSDNMNNIKMVLCPEGNSSSDVIMIGTLLNVCNLLSHKASRNPDEILKAAKFLMKRIEIVDKQHFDTMKQ